MSDLRRYLAPEFLSGMPLVFVLWCWFASAFVMFAATNQALYYYSRYVQATAILRLYEHRIYRLERLQEEYEETFIELHAQHQELHAWRVHVTNASRIGWPAANRYIREYPLQDVPAMEPWRDALPSIDDTVE